MKSEHRHELQTNDLSKWTEKIVRTLELYSNQILWTICGVLLVSAGIIYWVRSTRAAEASGWTSLDGARAPEDLELVSKNYKGTNAADWATLETGEAYLGSGIRDMFKDREKANTDLKKARTAFESLTSRGSLARELRMRALFGQAQCEESMSDGELSPVIGQYEKIVSEYPQTIYADLAKQRIEALKTSGAQGFYAWFHAQNPKLAEAPKPDDKGTRDEMPIFDEGPRLESSDKTPASGSKPAGEEKDDQPTPPKSTDDADRPKEESTDKPKEESTDKPKEDSADKPQDQPEQPKSDKPATGDSKEQAPADEAAKPE